ncbi:MAG: hypothetical protein MUC32_09195 [Burkholderiaceae bacterium]|jgi:hypothetical protein|nr:hypothetical protein [Burkholderiaceae bacterium]
MRHYALPLLAALNLALAGLLAWLWLTPDGELRDVRWQPPQPVPPVLADAKPLPAFDIDVVRYLATLERPLFLATRRPPPKPDEVAAAPPPDPMPNIRLLGVYGNDDVGGVIANVDGKVRRVRVGDSLSGRWVLKSRDGLRAVVARGDEQRTIELVRSAAPPPETVAATDTDTAAGGEPAAAAPARTAARERDLERRRDQVRRMNAARARRGMPPLPEP